MATSERPSLRLRALAWLLGLANACARSSTNPRAFYQLKDRLLRRYGRPAGEDVQRIVKLCWGYYDSDGCEGSSCRRCGGSGIWDRKLVVLERWELGGRVFHRPTRTVWGPEWEARVTIEGLIQHEGVSHRDGKEAMLWLALLFDRRLFWYLLRGSSTCVWTWRHPLLALQRVVFWARMRALGILPRRRRCWRCDHRFLAWRGRDVCARCASPYPQLATDDDLPF